MIPTEQKHYTGSTSTPPRVARLCQIFECAPTFPEVGKHEGHFLPTAIALSRIRKQRSPPTSRELTCGAYEQCRFWNSRNRGAGAKVFIKLSGGGVSRFRNPVETLDHSARRYLKSFYRELSSRHRVRLFCPRDRPLESKIRAAKTRWTREIFSYYPSLLLEPASGLCVKFCFSARTVCAAVGQFRAPTHALLFE